MQTGTIRKVAGRVALTWALLELAGLARAQQVTESDKFVEDERSGPIYSNSGNLSDPLGITRPGAGCNGLNISDVQTALGLETYGFACSPDEGCAVADDFVVPAGAVWKIDAVELYAFQRDAELPTMGPFPVRLQRESPLGQPIPALRTHPAVIMWTDVQKNLDLDPPGTSCNRHIQRCDVRPYAPFVATAGTHWVIWQAGGGMPQSRPWAAPVVVPGALQKPGSNALGASPESNGLFVPLSDAMPGRPAQDLAFVLYGTQWHTGDTNCDGRVDAADIDPFVVALNGESAYWLEHQNCVWLNADCDNSGTVDFNDIDPFVALLTRILGE